MNIFCRMASGVIEEGVESAKIGGWIGHAGWDAAKIGGWNLLLVKKDPKGSKIIFTSFVFWSARSPLGSVWCR